MLIDARLTSDGGSVGAPLPDCERPIHVDDVILDILVRKFSPHQPLCIVDRVGGVEKHLQQPNNPNDQSAAASLRTCIMAVLTQAFICDASTSKHTLHSSLSCSFAKG